MKRKSLFLFSVLFCQILSAQNFSIYGVVKDKSSGELLSGTTVREQITGKGTSSNNYGFYSLTLSKGIRKIELSFIGYKFQSYSINLLSDTIINIDMEIASTGLGEITIKANREDHVSGIEMSTQALGITVVKKIPAMMGEVDALKSLQLLPGVQTSHEGTTNLSIRGGSFDQNLILLDDAPVYNPSHALGFFSAFNPDAIGSIKVYKAAYPPVYGGRISSVIDVRMKEGNKKEFKGSGGIGLISSRLTIEGPIVKDAASFIVSGRYSYAGLTANILGGLGQKIGIYPLRNFDNNNEVNFFDLNAKVNYELNDKNHLYLSAYSGRDHFYYFSIDDNSSLDWGNINGTMRWNHVFNSKLFANTMFVFSNYYYAYILKDNAQHFKWSSNLKEFDIKTDFDYYINPNSHIKFGLAVEDHYYSPGKIEPRDSRSIITPFGLGKERAIIGAAYISNEQRIGDRLKLNYGVRYSSFFQLGETVVYDYSSNRVAIDSTFYGKNDLVQFYNGLEPRVSVRFMINENSSLKASFTKSKQYQHLISNSSVGFPTDVWLPASKHIKPQTSTQYAIGYFRNIWDDRLNFSAEVYYKAMTNIIDYKDNADLMLNKNIETQVLDGMGESYGLELFLKKDLGRLTGWLSYTLSKTSKKIDEINNGNWYPVRYDKRHNLSVFLNYEINEKWLVASTFKFSSGGFITVPEGVFNFQGVSFNYYTQRNGYQLPAYHRLDLSLNYKPGTKRGSKKSGEWNFGLNNVYSRNNVFSLFIKQVNNDLGSYKAYKMYLYGVIPFVSYNFKF